MDISALNSTMSALAMAQSNFSGAAQAASGISSPAAGSGDGSAAEAVQVAVLQKSLELQRSAVDILA